MGKELSPPHSLSLYLSVCLSRSLKLSLSLSLVLSLAGHTNVLSLTFSIQLSPISVLPRVIS